MATSTLASSMPFHHVTLQHLPLRAGSNLPPLNLGGPCLNQWNAVNLKLWDFWPRPQEIWHLPFSPPGALSYQKEVQLAYWRDRVEREKPASLRSS